MKPRFRIYFGLNDGIVLSAINKKAERLCIKNCYYSMIDRFSFAEVKVYIL